MRCIRMPTIQNLVATGGRASLSFPLGVTYEKLYLYLGTTGLAKSNISNIVLKLNNKEFQRWGTAADMEALNAYKGNLTSNAAYLIFDFTERLARQEVGMKLGTVAACQEAGIQSFTLEFDVSAFTLTGGVAPYMFADVEAPSINRIIQRVQMQQKSLAAAVQDIFYVPFGAQGYQLKRLLMKHTNLSSVKLRRDGVDIYEDLPVALSNAREQDFGRTPVAGYQVIDFMPDTLASNALNTGFVQTGFDAKGNAQTTPVQNLDGRITTSAADTVTIYSEAFSLNSQL